VKPSRNPAATVANAARKLRDQYAAEQGRLDRLVFDAMAMMRHPAKTDAERLRNWRLCVLVVRLVRLGRVAADGAEELAEVVRVAWAAAYPVTQRGARRHAPPQVRSPRPSPPGADERPQARPGPGHPGPRPQDPPLSCRPQLFRPQ
jgi:hypothetical protein